MGSKLYVGNLSFSTTEAELRDVFSQHGNVAEVFIAMDRFSGRSRGFAFVTMGSDAEAKAAITGVNGKNVGGRDLTVNEARPKTESAGRGFGGGGGGGGGGRPYGGGGGGGDRNRRY
jgi:RNA recognition motif-containing protein